MKKFYLLPLLVLSMTAALYAQTGELQGRVYDEATNEGIPFASVLLEQQGLQKYIGQTDDEGRYTIKPIVPGTYDLRVQYLGYQPVILTGVRVIAEQISFQNVAMKASATLLPEIKVVSDKLIEAGKTATGSTLDKTEIENLPTRNTINMASLTAAVFQRDDNRGLNVAGARENATMYLVDGIRMRGSLNLPQSSIEQLSVITGGLPAKYGDVLGGLVTITTRGPSQQYHGAAEMATSQWLDPYGYGLASLNFSGPLITSYKKTDSARSRAGFFITAEWERWKDRSAPVIPIYQLKPEVLQYLEQNPLMPSPTGSGFVPTSAFITADDLITQKYLPNNANNNYRFAGKLDFLLSDYMNITVGGNLNINHAMSWDYNSLLFAPISSNEFFYANVYRGFVRFTQRFPTSVSRDKEALFQNAYYSIQFDYQKEYERFGDKNHQFDAFKYGHVGRFETFRRPVYFYGQDSATGLTGWLLAGYLDTLVRYTPGTTNPLLANYTSAYFQLAGPRPQGYYASIYDIANGGGILNGSLPISTMTVYSMFLNTGYPSTAFGLRNNDQFHFSLNASVDLQRRGKGERGKHAIEFGVEYEQRLDRRYFVRPVGLWALARQLTNNHIQNLDTRNPQPVYDAFGVYLDTVNYNRLWLGEEQAYFDKSLRNKLGLNPSGLDFIDIDALDPSLLTLDMFSPDELLNNGSEFYFAYGYDYLGNVLRKQPSLEDYFSQRDANGNFTRNQPAYQPNYAAAYIQDRFNFRDLVFNIGVRVDRFDNNQFVLKDKYSLYPIRTVEEVTDLGPHPASVPKTAYVYVDDISQPSVITGYRDGDTWYNAQGTQIGDPKVVAQNTTTGLISPYLVNNDLNSLELGPSSFKDYEPQITVMPRIAFSFPISDEALFFAHYDVLTQRPSGAESRGVALATMFQYYFFRQLQGTIFANPDLKPEKTIDFQVGFKQALGNVSALTISGTYRELKDMIQVANVAYAYPNDYVTFTNSDFGTVKSLAFTYELRRLRNVKLDANYTLQFAAGTGSSATSGINLVGSGQPNLRTIVPFSYDQRHNITISADYRFGEGRNYNGPVWGKKAIPYLSNTGLNVILRAGSGTPYSKQTTPTPTALFGVATQTSLDGSVNGSRLPWSFKVDARLDKDFKVSDEKPLYVNVYLLCQNVFNAANILSVYAFTGNPDDDGYITSATGQQAVAGQLNPETFVLLYNIKQNRPGNYSLGRRLQLGAIFNF